VKTENLERLNEVLTGNKKITLSEDTSNSFTEENFKEISCDNDFRIVATCNEGEETRLSEAILSRFTEIYIDNYTKEEELKVLGNIALSRNDIGALNNLLNKYYTKFPDYFRMNLSQKINCFRICKELKEVRNKGKCSPDNLIMTLYYLLKGTNEKREENIKEINDIFDIKTYDDNVKNLSIHIEEKNEKEKKGKNEKEKEEKKIIRSQLNDSIMYIDLQKDKKDENLSYSLFFTNKIKEIIDTIHFGFSTSTPIVLEGGYGQGKKSAIEYYAKISKLELIQVTISKSTTVEDLLVKTIFKKNEKGNFSLVNTKTPLCKAIEYSGYSPNQLVLIEGINNATPAVLEKLNSIYDKIGTEILLPNGSTIIKGKMNLISIFN